MRGSVSGGRKREFAWRLAPPGPQHARRATTQNGGRFGQPRICLRHRLGEAGVCMVQKLEDGRPATHGRRGKRGNPQNAPISRCYLPSFDWHGCCRLRCCRCKRASNCTAVRFTGEADDPLADDTGVCLQSLGLCLNWPSPDVRCGHGSPPRTEERGAWAAGALAAGGCRQGRWGCKGQHAA